MEIAIGLEISPLFICSGSDVFDDDLHDRVKIEGLVIDLTVFMRRFGPDIGEGRSAVVGDAPLEDIADRDNRASRRGHAFLGALPEASIFHELSAARIREGVPLHRVTDLPVIERLTDGVRGIGVQLHGLHFRDIAVPAPGQGHCSENRQSHY